MKKLYPDIFKFIRKYNIIRWILSDIKLVIRAIILLYESYDLYDFRHIKTNDRRRSASRLYIPSEYSDFQKKYCCGRHKFWDTPSIEIVFLYD
jgi:hypothetical protein